MILSRLWLNTPQALAQGLLQYRATRGEFVLIDRPRPFWEEQRTRHADWESVLPTVFHEQYRRWRIRAGAMMHLHQGYMRRARMSGEKRWITPDGKI